MPSAVLFPGQRRSAVRRRLPRCFRCARPRRRSFTRVRPSTCPSPSAGLLNTRKPLPGPVGSPELAPAAQPPRVRPSRMEVTQPGGWKRALPRPAGTRRPRPRALDHKSVPLPISSLDGSSQPGTPPADPAASDPESQHIILLGRCGVPPGGSRPRGKHSRKPSCKPYTEEPRWGSGGLFPPRGPSDFP